jgi:hypothetical protein
MRAADAARRRSYYPGAMLDLNVLDLGEIAYALSDQADYEHCLLIHSQTGEIVYWSAETGIDGHTKIDLDDLDPELISIRPLPSWVWYQDMEEFAQGITDDRAGRSLARAIQGRGAFRRFKDKLNEEYPKLLPAWYAFSEARALRRAVEWLAEEELVDQEIADRYQADHPEPALPLRSVTIELRCIRCNKQCPDSAQEGCSRLATPLLSWEIIR